MEPERIKYKQVWDFTSWYTLDVSFGIIFPSIYWKSQTTHLMAIMQWLFTVFLSRVRCFTNGVLFFESSQFLTPFYRWWNPRVNQRIGVTFVLVCCSVAQSCPTLCNPMDCSTPSFPAHHQLPELAQTRVHWAAIQPSHPLSSPSPPAFNIFQLRVLHKINYLG